MITVGVGNYRQRCFSPGVEPETRSREINPITKLNVHGYALGEPVQEARRIAGNGNVNLPIISVRVTVCSKHRTLGILLRGCDERF